MVIDVHYHPYFFEEVCKNEETAEQRRQSMAYYKTGVCRTERIFERLTASGVDRCFLLPHDFTTLDGDLITNEEMQMLTEKGCGRFYGFAGVDPHREDAAQVVEHAFRDLGLCGLKLHPSRQKFHPTDKKLAPIYEVCEQYNKPVMFHSGFTWQPNAVTELAHPMNFEALAASRPKLRFCLAHMGFPWVRETAMLLLKYPNVYADTAFLYFDSAREFYEYVFTKEMSPGWVDRSIRHQIMFGSNMPRWEEMRMLKALRGLHFREETMELLTCRNALEFLGEEETNWLS